uniref:Vacuolar protein sorting-associated protein 52 homolog n=1 Tax=Panagrellus redivivus TaxID=6233 RepID=A0A7E4VFQ7_PANRE
MASGSDASMSEPSTSTGTTSGKDIEVILKWSRDELKQALTGLVMHSFHEASSSEAPRVLAKEIASLLRELDSLISLITNLTGFSVNLLPVMRQHSQRVDRINISRIDKQCYDPDCTNPVTAFVTYTGPAYKPRAFVLDPTVSEDERVFYCTAHHFIADRLYSLIHMRWNIMLNAQHRLAKTPTLMGELNPEAFVVTNLVNYYMYLISDFSPSSGNKRHHSVITILNRFFNYASKWEAMRKLSQTTE